MPHPRLPFLLARALPLAALIAVAPPAAAGTVDGTVTLPPSTQPDGAAAGDERPLCYWRLDNGVLPIAPPLPESKQGIPVVLEPIPPTPPTPLKKDQNGELVSVPLEAGALHMSPPLLVVDVNEPIDLHNRDKVPHTYFLVDGERFLPRKETPAGGHRLVTFSVPSTYRIADAGSAREGATVLVVASGFSHALTDEDGGFTVDAPEGSYKLRAYYHGAWTPEQTVEVAKKKAEVTVTLQGSAVHAAAPSSPEAKPSAATPSGTRPSASNEGRP